MLTGCAPSPRPFTPILTFPHQGGRDQTPLMSTPGLRGCAPKRGNDRGYFHKNDGTVRGWNSARGVQAGRRADRKLPQSACPGALGEAAALLAQGLRRPPRVFMCAGFPVALPESHAVRSCPPPSVILRDVFDPQLVTAPIPRFTTHRDVKGPSVASMVRHAEQVVGA